MGAPVTDLSRKRVPEVGWPTAKGATLSATNPPCLRLVRLHELKSGDGGSAVFAEVNSFLRVSVQHRGEVECRLILMALGATH